MMTRCFLVSALIMCLALACAVPAPAALVVYEGFDYPAGTIDGSQSGGTGMGGSWTSSGSNPYTVQTPGLSLGSLPTEGGLVRRPSAPGGAEMHRGISAAAQTALTEDHSTIWFSVLVRNDRYSVGNEDGSFVLATGALDVQSGDRKPNTIEGGAGQGIGLQLNGFYPNDSTIDVYAYVVDSSGDYRSTGKLNNDTSVNTFLIAGKIEWAPNGNSDTVRLFNITDPTEPEPVDGDAFATATADLDQSQFDTLAIANRQVSSLDEIRFATTFHEVMGSASPGLPPGMVLLIR